MNILKKKLKKNIIINKIIFQILLLHKKIDISLNNINQIENRSQRFQNSYINNSSYTEYNKNRMNQFGNNSSINSYFYNKNKENKFSETSNYEKNRTIISILLIFLK